MKKFIIILLILAWAGVGFAADRNIYIDADAAAGGDGSIEAPYDAFTDINWTTGGDNSIFDWVATDDDVYINLQGGSSWTERLQVQASGAVDHRITIQPYGTGYPEIVGDPDTYAQLSVDSGVNHIRVTGIKFTGTPKHYSISFLDCDDIVLDNCVFEDSKSVKFVGDGASIYNNSFTRNRDGSANAVIHIDSAVNSGATDYVYIYNNMFTDCYTTESIEVDGHMICLAGGTATSRPLKRVRIYNNTMSGCGSKSGKSAITVYNAEDVWVYSNKILNGYQAGITVGTNSKDVDVFNNIIMGNRLSENSTNQLAGILVAQSTGGCATCNTMENINIINNTIVDNDDTETTGYVRAGIRVYVASLVDFTLNNIAVKNNIIKNNFTSSTADPYSYEFQLFHLSNPTVTNIDVDNNIYYRTVNTDYFTYWEDTVYTVAQFETYKTAAGDADSESTDPLLTAHGRLIRTSPAIDAGVWITGVNDQGYADPWGKYVHRLPNIGADQGAGSPVRGGMLRIGR